MPCPSLRLVKAAAVLRRRLLRAGAVCLLCAEIAHPQSDRWVQLMQQEMQLENQGSDAAALPLEKQAEQIAEATCRPQDLHTGVALNALGIVDDHLEKFGDAETNLKRAFAIFTRVDGAGRNNLMTRNPPTWPR
jgi:hypothetical protein